MATSAGYPVDTVANLELNTLFDGLFHTSTYLMTAVGLALLWSGTRLPRVRWSTMLLIGGLLVGWGTFNVVEGIASTITSSVSTTSKKAPPTSWLGTSGSSPGARRCSRAGLR